MSNKAKTVVTTTFDRVAFLKLHGTKSAAIRSLLAQKKTRGEVAKMLGVLYQHVRNVDITPIKNARVVTTFVQPGVDGSTPEFDEFGPVTR